MIFSPFFFQFRPPRPIDSRATLTIGDKTFDCDASDLQLRRYLGRGAYGVVEEVEHRPSNTVMAVKVRVKLVAVRAHIIPMPL